MHIKKKKKTCYINDMNVATFVCNWRLWGYM